jgi:hypothetical protein
VSAPVRELVAERPGAANQQARRSQRLVAFLGLSLLVWVALYVVIQPASDLVTRRLLGLDPSTHLGSAIAFFLFEVPKVLLLLLLVVFVVGVVRSFLLSPNAIKELIAK